MKAFEVGKTYIVYCRGNHSHFRAKCISRTAKKVRFEAGEMGAVWYMPELTMTVTESEGIHRAADGEIEELAISRKRVRSTVAVVAYAGDLAMEQL